MYVIAQREDISVARAKRYRLRIVVNPGSGKEVVQGAIEDAVKKLSVAERVNALVVFAYDRKEDVGGVYTLAKADWAPNGVWAEAVDAQPGDYSKHRFIFDFRKKVTEPAAVTRPSDEQFALWDALMRLLKANPNTPEAQLRTRVAVEAGTSAEAVKDAADTVQMWQFQ